MIGLSALSAQSQQLPTLDVRPVCRVQKKLLSANSLMLKRLVLLPRGENKPTAATLPNRKEVSVRDSGHGLG
jgi:hypothetical protein